MELSHTAKLTLSYAGDTVPVIIDRLTGETPDCPFTATESRAETGGLDLGGRQP
jgi:hypothetical protein